MIRSLGFGTRSSPLPAAINCCSRSANIATVNVQPPVHASRSGILDASIVRPAALACRRRPARVDQKNGVRQFVQNEIGRFELGCCPLLGESKSERGAEVAGKALGLG